MPSPPSSTVTGPPPLDGERDIIPGPALSPSRETHSSSRRTYPSSRCRSSFLKLDRESLCARVQSPSISPPCRALQSSVSLAFSLSLSLSLFTARRPIRLPKRLPLADRRAGRTDDTAAAASPFALLSEGPVRCLSGSLPSLLSSFLVGVPRDFAPRSYGSLRHN